MAAPDKQLVARRFRRGLSSYSESAAIQHVMAEKLSALICRRRKHFPRVLEIGAGTGLLTAHLDETITWEQRIVNDLVADCARFHVGRDHTVFLPGDAEAADWGNEPFDLICSNAAFQWLERLPEFLKKLKKSLTGNGLLAFTTFGPHNLRELRALTGHGLHYYSLQQLTEELIRSGFTVLESGEKEVTRSFDDPLDLLKMMRRTGVTASSDKSWWTARRLAEFRHAYREQFSTPEHSVKATWHPIYILAQNEGGNQP